MIDQVDEPDDGDWLAAQFGAPDAKPARTPPPAAPVPPASAPAPGPTGDGGSFAWGLRPRAEAAAPPTAPMSWEDVATVAAPAPARPSAPPPAPSFAASPPPAEMPTAAFSVQAWQPAQQSPPAPPAQLPPTQLFQPGTPAASDDPTSAIDSLFGSTQFKEYDDVALLQTFVPPPLEPASDPQRGRPPRGPLSTTEKRLIWAAAALFLALALLALFAMGTRLGIASAATTPKPTAKPSALPATGVLPPGSYAYSQLRGGECIQPFTSAWAATFKVVDCSAGHDAQLISRGVLTGATGASYPTAQQIQAEVTPICTGTTVLNYANAAAVTDVQLAIAYPPTESAWNRGDRDYYCFVTLASGGNLPGNLAVAAG